MDPRQQHGKHNAVLMQHAECDAIVRRLEELRCDDGETCGILFDTVKLGVIDEHAAEYVEEELQRVLVQEVHLRVYNKGSLFIAMQTINENS